MTRKWRLPFSLMAKHRKFQNSLIKLNGLITIYGLKQNSTPTAMANRIECTSASLVPDKQTLRGLRSRSSTSPAHTFREPLLGETSSGTLNTNWEPTPRLTMRRHPCRMCDAESLFREHIFQIGFLEASPLFTLLLREPGCRRDVQLLAATTNRLPPKPSSTGFVAAPLGSQRRMAT